MDKKYMERLFSAGRLARFYQVAGQDANEAGALYAGNIRLSESLYPSLAVAEVALRNALHRQLSYLYQTADWHQLLGQQLGLAALLPTLHKAQQQIMERREIVSADKMVAELNFGFWVTLFNRAYEDVLWKQLRLAFAHLPKNERQRPTVSVVLNAIRTLRNRVYHNEPVCWNLPELVKQHSQTMQLIGWVEPQLVEWLLPLDRFPAVLREEQDRRAAHRRGEAA